MSVTYLKIKIKSLAAEQRIIRKEERKYCKARLGDSPVRQGLYEHRVYDIRPELRSAYLAYGFLRNRPYKVIEAKTNKAIDWKNVYRLIEKYGKDTDKRVLAQRFAEWKDAATSK